MKYMTWKQKEEIIRDTNEICLVLMDYYYSKAGVSEYDYSNAKSDAMVAKALGWTVTKVRDNRLKLEKAGYLNRTTAKKRSIDSMEKSYTMFEKPPHPKADVSSIIERALISMQGEDIQHCSETVLTSILAYELRQLLPKATVTTEYPIQFQYKEMLFSGLVYRIDIVVETRDGIFIIETKKIKTIYGKAGAGYRLDAENQILYYKRELERRDISISGCFIINYTKENLSNTEVLGVI